MGRQNTELVATITIDLKDRSGITRVSNIKLGHWDKLVTKHSTLIVNQYDFKFTDDGMSKVTTLADKVFDTYFDNIIYPAVQGFRVLYPQYRVNVNVTISGSVPYRWSKVKYYTGEYITMVPVMPKFDAYHHAYYVIRALFSATKLSEVAENLKHTTQAALIHTSYADLKKDYQKACSMGSSKVKTKVGYTNCDESFSTLVLGADDWRWWYDANMARNKHIQWIDQVWWRSHHAGEDVTHRFQASEPEAPDDASDNSLFDLFLDDEGYFDITNCKGGDE